MSANGSVAASSAVAGAKPALPLKAGVKQVKAIRTVLGSAIPTAAAIAHAEASLPALFIHSQESHVDRYIETIETKEWNTAGKAGILGTGDDWVLVKLPAGALNPPGTGTPPAGGWTLRRILVDMASFDGFLRNTHRISICTRRFNSFDELINGWTTADPLVSSYAKLLPLAPTPGAGAGADAKSDGAVMIAAGGTVCTCCGTVRPPPSAQQKATTFRINNFPQQDDAVKLATEFCKRNVSMSPGKHASHVLCLTEITPVTVYLKREKEHNNQLIDNILGRYEARHQKPAALDVKTQLLHSDSPALSMSGPTAVDTTGIVGLPKVEVAVGASSRPLAKPDAAAATATTTAASDSKDSAIARTVIPIVSAAEQERKENIKKAKRDARAATKPTLTKEQRTAMRKAEDEAAVRKREERRIRYEQKINAGLVSPTERDPKLIAAAATTTAPAAANDAKTAPASAASAPTAAAASKPVASTTAAAAASDSKKLIAASDKKAVAKAGAAAGAASGEEPAFNPNASRAQLVSDWVGWYVGVMPANWLNEMNQFKAVLASTNDVLCRARFKLEEIYQRFSVSHCAKCRHATPFRLVFDEKQRIKLVNELKKLSIIPSDSDAAASAGDADALNLRPHHDKAATAAMTAIDSAANQSAATATATATSATASGIIPLGVKKRNNCSGRKKRERREKRHAQAAAAAASGATDTKSATPASAATATPATNTAAATADSKSSNSNAATTAAAATASATSTSAPAAAATRAVTCNCGCGCIHGRKLHALDLGAAPGGWTAFLSERLACYTSDPSVGSIVAVDPGALHPSVSSRPNVSHYRLLLQQAMPALHRFGGVDLVVCDMCMEPLAMYGLINEIAPVMSRGSPLVLTLKFHKRPSAGTVALQWGHIQKALSAQFTDFSLYWLFAGTQSERTVFAYKK